MVAKDLTPSFVALLDPSRVVALATGERDADVALGDPGPIDGDSRGRGTG